MNDRLSKNSSFAISLMLHLGILILLYYTKLEVEYPVKEYIEVGFGGITGGSSNTGAGSLIPDVEKKKVEPEKIKDKVEVPKTKNTFDNDVAPVTKKNVEKPVLQQSSSTSGTGTSGFDIEWGGNGKRKIYSYTLPAYPDGVNKEIDIRLRFSILPDGTVGTIFPLTKADTRLENAAINSLRQWRFEPLPFRQKKIEQFAIIVFPYRLQ